MDNVCCYLKINITSRLKLLIEDGNGFVTDEANNIVYKEINDMLCKPIIFKDWVLAAISAASFLRYHTSTSIENLSDDIIFSESYMY